MANLNIPIISVEDIAPVNGKYEFLAKFFTSAGNLVVDTRFPQNQVISTDSLVLPDEVTVTVADGQYLIVGIKLHLQPTTGGKNIVIDLNNTYVDCTSSGCIPPTFTNYTVSKPVCNNGVTNNIGSVVVTGVANYDKYKLFVGTPIAGYNTANSGTGNTISVPVNYPTVPATSIIYTLRLYNENETCNTDISFSVLYEECSSEACCDITPGSIIIDGNDLSSCDLIQTTNPEFKISGSNKQIKAFLYSARPNIGPFRYRIYNSLNNLVQVIYPVTDPNVYYTLDPSLVDGIYSLTVEDSKGCPPTSPKTFSITSGGGVTNNLETSIYMTD